MLTSRTLTPAPSPLVLAEDAHGYMTNRPPASSQFQSRGGPAWAGGQDSAATQVRATASTRLCSLRLIFSRLSLAVSRTVLATGLALTAALAGRLRRAGLLVAVC